MPDPKIVRGGGGGGGGVASWLAASWLNEGHAVQARQPPPPRTKWTRRVPHSVLIGHAAS